MKNERDIVFNSEETLLFMLWLLDTYPAIKKSNPMHGAVKCYLFFLKCTEIYNKGLLSNPDLEKKIDDLAPQIIQLYSEFIQRTPLP